MSSSDSLTAYFQHNQGVLEWNCIFTNLLPAPSVIERNKQAFKLMSCSLVFQGISLFILVETGQIIAIRIQTIMVLSNGGTQQFSENCLTQYQALLFHGTVKPFLSAFYKIISNLNEFAGIQSNQSEKSFRDNYKTRMLQGRPGIMGGYDTIFIKKSNIYTCHQYKALFLTTQLTTE